MSEVDGVPMGSSSVRRRRRWRVAGGLAALILLAALVPALTARLPANAAPITLWGDRPSAVPIVDGDSAAVELGTVFTPAVDGEVTGVRFWKTHTNTGTHTGRLWGPGGEMLAEAMFSHESGYGWQTVTFSDPISVTAGRRYVASYHAPDGGYVESTEFTQQSQTDLLSVPRGASGVYAYGTNPAFPRDTWRQSQYWVDVLFVPNGEAGTPRPSASTPTVGPSEPATPSPSPTATVTSTPGPRPTRTPGPVPTTTPSSTPTDPAPGGAPAPDPLPPAEVAAQPSLGTGWNLSASSVGLAAQGLTCSQLPVYSQSSHVIPAGTVIQRQRLTTWYDLSAGNITIKDSCIQPAPGAIGPGSFALSTWGGTPSGPVTIEDSEYDGSLLSSHDAAWIGMFTGVANFYRNYVHDSGSGLVEYVTGQKTGADVVVQNNYVDHLIADGDAATSGNHESAMTVRDFDTSVNPDRQLLIRDNFFNCDGQNASGALFIQPNDGDVRNVTVQGNLLAGYGYQFYLDYQPLIFPGVTYANIRAVDNRMDETHAGAVFVREGGPGVAEWEDNYTYSAAGIDGEGHLIGNPNP